MGIKLSVLRCPKCQNKLSAENNDIIIYCRSCKNVFEFKNMKLQEIKASKTVYDTDGIYQAFWKYQIFAKYTKTGFFGSKEQKERSDIYVPAFMENLSEIVSLGRRFSFSRKDISITTTELIVQPLISSNEGAIIAEYILLNHLGSNMTADELQKFNLSSDIISYSLLMVKIKT